jgi:hypothetical protein
MVALHNGRHEHGDGEVCPACRFREVLAAFLAECNAEGREEWHWAVGDLRQRMHAALLAIDRVEASGFVADDADDEPEVDAANAITAVASVIEELWHALMKADGQGDD